MAKFTIFAVSTYFERCRNETLDRSGHHSIYKYAVAHVSGDPDKRKDLVSQVLLSGPRGPEPMQMSYFPLTVRNDSLPTPAFWAMAMTCATRP